MSNLARTDNIPVIRKVIKGTIIVTNCELKHYVKSDVYKLDLSLLDRGRSIDMVFEKGDLKQLYKVLKHPFGENEVIWNPNNHVKIDLVAHKLRVHMRGHMFILSKEDIDHILFTLTEAPVKTVYLVRK